MGGLRFGTLLRTRRWRRSKGTRNGLRNWPLLPMAIISSLLFYGVDLMPPNPAEWLAANLVHSIQINAVLCVFNMLPLPPLDGGRVAVGLLPDALALPLARVERYGMLILLLFLFVLPYVGEQTGHNLNILGWLIGAPTEALIRFILAITGQSE